MTDSLPVPPPPPSSDRRITAVLATGAAAFVSGLLWPGAHDPAGWIGAALLIHGGDAWLRRRGRAALAHRLLGSLGGPIVPAVAGGYGLLTLARFVQLQAEDLLLALTDPARWAERLGEYAQGLLLGYGRLSIEHAVEAFLWPVRLLDWIGPIGLGLGFAAGGWLWHRAQLRVAQDGPQDAPKDSLPPAPPPG